jgi:hypothetical protein
MRAVVVVSVLIVTVGGANRGGAAKGGAVQACSLLRADEIAGVTGTKAGEGHETDTPISSGPQKGETLAGCMWKLGEQGMVTVNVIPAATGAAREAGLAKLHQGMEKLKSQGWKQDKQSFGSVVCSTMTPPPSQKSMPVAVGCMGEAKGMGVSVGSMSPGSAVAIPKIKALFDKATSRLP